jgi:hypothetical protein
MKKHAIKKSSKKTASKKPSSGAEQQSFAKKFQIEIPAECDSLEKKLQWLSAQAEKPLEKLEISNARNSIKIGQLLLVAKEKVKIQKGPKKDWGQCLAAYFPQHKRTAQIAMLLARYIDLEEFPAAVKLGKTKLTELVRAAKAKDRDIMDFLQDKGIKTDFDTKDKKEIEKFQKAVGKVLKDAKEEKHDKKRTRDRIAEMVDAFFVPLEMALKNMKQAKGALLKNIPEMKFRNAILKESRKEKRRRILQSIKSYWIDISKASESPKAAAKKMTSRSLQQRD